MKEKTISKIVSLEGIGLHSGKIGKTVLYPLSEGSGVIFKNIDTGEEIQASIDNVANTKRGITLKGKTSIVKTPEHLLSALYVMGVSNVLIEYRNEIPIGDGSAATFIKLIKSAEILDQKREREEYALEESVFVREGCKVVIGLPFQGFRIRYLIDYPDTYIESEYYDFLFDEEFFIEDISKAKTFGFYDELSKLRSENLSLGGSLKNAILVDKENIYGELAVKREFVKHKIIDFLGDISLLNKFIRGDFILIKAGHDMHIKIAKKLKELGGF